MIGRAAFPHCDTRVLHAPGECGYCDGYADWQGLRRLWGIAFTGHQPQTTVTGKQLPCPADFNRPPDSPSDHRQWPGNIPKDGGPPVDIEALTEAYIRTNPPKKRRRMFGGRR